MCTVCCTCKNNNLTMNSDSLLGKDHLNKTNRKKVFHSSS